MDGLTLMQSTTSGLYDFIVCGMFVSILGKHFKSWEQCLSPFNGMPCSITIHPLLHRFGNIIHRYIRYMYHMKDSFYELRA